MWMRSQGEYDAARQALEVLMPLEERVKGAEHPGTLATRHLLAKVMRDQSGYDAA